MREADDLLKNLKDCLQVFKVAQAMIPQIQGQFENQMGQPSDIEHGHVNSI